MEDEHSLRIVLLSLLLESQVRLAAFAKIFPAHFVGPVFTALARERLEILQDILRQHSEPEFVAAMTADGRNTGMDVAIQEAETGRKGDETAAAETVIAAERDLQSFLVDMPSGVLDSDLAGRLLALLNAAIERLMTARNNTLSSETRLTFSVNTQAREMQGEAVPVYEVWFGTNRSREGGGDDLTFSNTMADHTTLGRCEVSIPSSHRIGQIEPDWMRRIFLGEQPMRVEKTEVLADRSFWAGVRKALSDGDTEAGDALVFLHGYRVSFDAAALCAAQIGADLNVPGGATAFFSWPSKGRFFGYAADEATIEASEGAITDFLEAFTERSGVRRVNIIAHSMGNRGLLRAVNRIAASAAERTGKRFGQIVLAAPDVDRRTFKALHDAYAAVAEGVTLYVSDKDLAVRSSRALHGAERVGFAPPVTVLPGMDTISVSKVDLSWLGHGYVADCRTVLTDIHQLFVSGFPPQRRAGMTEVKGADGDYWELSA